MSEQQAPSISPEYAELLAQLRAFVFDEPGAVDCFSRRLAKEQRWSRRFTLRAIEEYRKFIFIWLVTGEEVAPSLIVDKVWHLHLQFTESYWHKLCRDLLKKELHHKPSDGSAADRANCGALYRSTLERYRTFFGEPPWDIWNIPPRDLNELGRRMGQVLLSWLEAAAPWGKYPWRF